MHKLCLNSNDFKENIVNAIGTLREINEFTDVTLTCDGDEVVQAHQLMLSSSSQYFRNVLKKTNHPKPCIHLRGLKSKDIKAVIDFIYYGECSIEEEDLDEFLALAEDLKIKGISGSSREYLKKPYNSKALKLDVTLKSNFSVVPSNEDLIKTEEIPRQVEPVEERENETNGMGDIPKKTTRKCVTLTESMDLYKTIATMMEYQDNVWNCTVCGKQIKNRNSMSYHVEVHIDGASHPCNICGKTYSSRNSLQNHTSTSHKKDQIKAEETEITKQVESVEESGDEENEMEDANKKTTWKCVTLTENMDLDKTINTLMEYQDNVWNCTICGKQIRDRARMSYHVEVHIDGVSHPCPICGKTYRSRNSLQNHNYTVHKKAKQA